MATVLDSPIKYYPHTKETALGSPTAASMWLCYRTVKHEFSEFTHSIAKLPTLHLTHSPPEDKMIVTYWTECHQLWAIKQTCLLSQECPLPISKLQEHTSHVGQALKVSFLARCTMLHFNTFLQSTIRFFTKILLSLLVFPHLPKPHTSLLQM